MMKRERDEAGDRGEGMSNGNKLARVAGQFTDRAGEDTRGAASQDLSAGLSARKNNQQPTDGTWRDRDDIRHEIYKEGRRFKYDGSVDASAPPPLVLVRVPVEYLQFHNRQVKSRQLWGVDTYTHDSDVVAILMHCGYISASAGVPRELVAEAQVLLEYLPGRASYPSCHRNGIRSRAWGDYCSGSSIRVAKCVLTTRSGNEEELQPFPNGMAAVLPTFAPSHFERVMSTRASASSVERRQRAMQEVPMQYNLCNEPWLKYSMQVIADRGLKPSQLTSARLHKEVLYLETARERYEVSLEEAAVKSEQPDPNQAEHYRLARCRKAYPLPKLRKLGIPQPLAEVETLQAGLQWEDFEWSQAGVSVKGTYYPLMRLHFTSIQQPPAAAV